MLLLKKPLKSGIYLIELSMIGDELCQAISVQVQDNGSRAKQVNLEGHQTGLSDAVLCMSQTFLFDITLRCITEVLLDILEFYLGVTTGIWKKIKTIHYYSNEIKLTGY
jgi:hypothetical protein